MAGKNKFHLNTNMIRMRLKDLKYTYNDIVEKSYEQITQTMLKHFMNKGEKADEETIQILANILELNGNEIIEPGDLFSINIPYEINRLTKGLYCRNRDDIQVVYAEKLKIFREKAGLEKMLEITHSSLIQFTSDDLFLRKASIPDIIGKILKTDPGFTYICNHELTEITITMANEIAKQFEFVVDEEYNPHQLFLIFLYVFVLFDAVFLAECIASAYQLMPQRAKAAKTDQYFDLAKRIDDMRTTLIKNIIYNDKAMKFDSVFEGMTIEDAGLDNEVLTGILLMLLACEMCHEHQKSLYHKSEYVNRSRLDAIIRRLEDVFSNIRLPIETSPWSDIMTSRFGKHYFTFQALTRTSRVKQKDNCNDMMIGYMIGVSKK